MELVVTHLSSLSGGRVCAAGWCPVEKRFVRLKSGPDAWDFLSRNQTVIRGRPITTGDVIAFDHRALAPLGPQCENVWVLPHSLAFRRTLEWDEYLSILERCSAATLAEGLGGKPEQKARGHSCRMHGAVRSLCVRGLDISPTFELDEFDANKVRTRWKSDGLDIRSLIDWAGLTSEPHGESLGAAVSKLSAEVAGADRIYFSCSLALPVEGDSYWLVIAAVRSFGRGTSRSPRAAYL